MEPTQLESSAAQLEQSAHQIQKDQTQFDDNIFAQEVQANLLRKCWPHLNPQDQRLLLQQFALLFPRTREDNTPQECLRKILELPSGEDVQRALRVRASNYLGYRTDPGEEIYPSTGWFGRYLDYARWNKVPLALHFWAGASIFGAAVRRNFFVDNNIDYTWMNQFIILTGPKGNGKSAARGIAQDILYRMNRKLAEREKKGKLSSARAFQIPMLPSDITPQDLTKQLSEWSALPRHTEIPPFAGQPEPGEAVAILISDELSNLAGKGTYGASLMVPLLTELCFNSRYSKSTKSGGLEEIDRMAFSILACTQPGWMRDTIVSDAKEGGFIERVNFIHRPPSSRKWNWLEIPAVDPLLAEELAEELVPIAMRPGQPQLLQVVPEGKRYFSDWYDREYAGGPRDAADASKHTLDRRCIHLMRMAGLLCISEGDSLPEIQLSHLRQAIQIVEAEDQYLPMFMAEANETADAQLCREIVAWVASMGGEVTKTQFGQHPKFGPLGAKKRDELMGDHLLPSGRLVLCSKGRKGVWYGLPEMA